MHASFSTIMMAVITTNLMLTLLTLCLTSKKILLNTGYKLLACFVVLVIVRMALPFEFFFTKTYAIPGSISPIIGSFRHWLFYIGDQPVSLWSIFQIIWLLGVACHFILIIYRYFKFISQLILYGKELTDSEPYSSIVADICNEQNYKGKFRIVAVPGICTPFLQGIFHPCIVLPEHLVLSDKELYYSLRHEIAHHIQHDLLLKTIVKCITTIYWWNPFCHMLYAQASTILEMRIDDRLTQSNPALTYEYIDCLLSISLRAAEQASFPTGVLTLNLLPKQSTELSKRVHLLAANQNKPNFILNYFALGFASFIYICSYLFIYEAYYINNTYILEDAGFDSDAEFLIPSTDSSYFIDNGDGTYDFYNGGLFLEATDSLEYYPSDIPIYTKENCPY